MRRILTWGSVLVGLVAVLLAAAVYAVVFTQGGLRFLISHLPERFGTAQVRIEQVHGTLASGVHVGQVLIDQRHVNLRLEDVYTRVHLSTLSWHTLVSPVTRIRTAYVRIKSAPPLPPAPHPQFLPWWLQIHVAHAQIGAVTLVLADGRRIEGTGLDGTVHLSHRNLRIPHLAVRIGHASYRLAATLHAARPLQLSLGGDVAWSTPRRPHWRGTVALHGTVSEFSISAHLHEPFTAAVHGRLRERNGRWRVQGELGIRRLDLQTWHHTDRFGHISAQLALAGGLEGFRIGGSVDPAGLHAGPFHVELDGRYVDGVLQARRFTLTHPASGAALAASGTARFSGGRPPRIDTLLRTADALDCELVVELRPRG